MHVETYSAFFTPRDKEPSHSSSEETSSEFVWLEIKITRKQKCGGKPKQVLCRYISYYPPLSITLHTSLSLHDIKDIYIYRRYFLRNIQRDIFNLPLDILNIPILSVVDYNEKIGNYTKYLKITWRFRKSYMELRNFRKWFVVLRNFRIWI